MTNIPKSRISKAKRIEYFRLLAEHIPNPETELAFASHFQLLIAVMLSAQATDIAVNKVTEILFAQAPDAKAMVQLGETRIREIIQKLGLFNTKAKNAWLIANILLEQHQGQVPDDRAALEALPGVGRKTANVVLNTAFRQIAMAVDTHIFRVSNRTGLAPGKNVIEVEQGLLKYVPQDYLLDAHHWLILHGRYTCKARKPVCGTCCIQHLCVYKDKQL